MIASLFHGFIWGVATGVVLIIIRIAIWNWRHPGMKQLPPGPDRRITVGWFAAFWHWWSNRK